ncbi:MurR/RpiR family transcriptional regulator [uncultured Propionivibrio sp.]|uniref:MurR/RpiR family transcriptional regulator n=1 Tax=uncultured Propionivibrio sp. TaxID=426737 RepID=UPI0029C06010|nr:MurR/RpiR family transcriptional regulator [uncultured Propionivibrio sp.]
MKKTGPAKNKKEFTLIDERIGALTETLPDSERKLAELLSSRQVLLATHSATELAALAGSSKAAVTRFIQRVGYKSFAEARREAREAQCWGAPAFQYAPDLSSVSEDAFAKHLQSDLDNLARTFERLNPKTVERAIDAIVKARRVAVIGYRNSHALAQYLVRQLVLLKDAVTLLPQAGQTVGEDLAGFTADDMIIVLAFRRRVPVVDQIVQHARQIGLPALILTDAGTPANEVPGDWRIVCETRGSAQFDSYAAAMSVLNLLVSTLALRPEIANKHRLLQAERLHSAFSEL